MSEASPNLGRPGVFAGEGADGVAGHPDAALLAACAAFEALEVEYRATDYDAEVGSVTEEAADVERERIIAAQRVQVDRMVELRARTAEGLRARAQSLIVWHGGLIGQSSLVMEDRIIYAIVRDLTET